MKRIYHAGLYAAAALVIGSSGCAHVRPACDENLHTYHIWKEDGCYYLKNIESGDTDKVCSPVGNELSLSYEDLTDSMKMWKLQSMLKKRLEDQNIVDIMIKIETE